MSIGPSHQRIYGEPTVPIPLAHARPSWKRRTNSASRNGTCRHANSPSKTIRELAAVQVTPQQVDPAAQRNSGVFIAASITWRRMTTAGTTQRTKENVTRTKKKRDDGARSQKAVSNAVKKGKSSRRSKTYDNDPSSVPLWFSVQQVMLHAKCGRRLLVRQPQ